MNNLSKYPIRVVANKTGLSTHVIRAWEKRYGAVVPDRTDSNRRLYTDQEVHRLEMLSQITSMGYTISQVADLSDDELNELLPERTEKPVQDMNQITEGDVSLEDDASQIVEQSLAAIKDLDQKKFERILMRASTIFSQPELIDKIISPLIHKNGDLWAEGQLRTTHEHFATAVLRSFLGNLWSSFEVPDTAPKIIVTTPAGQVHELGALIVAATTSSLGWQTIYLGPNLPAEEIAAAAEMKRSNLVSLSIIYPPADKDMSDELKKLRRLLPSDVEIIAGGRAVATYDTVLREINATVISSLSDFRKYLHEKSV